MESLFPVLLVVAAAILLSEILAARYQVPEAVTLVGVGLAASLVPWLPTGELSSDVVFYVFLPPLVYRAAFLITPATLRRWALAIGLLAVALVLFTAFAVAVTLSFLGMGFALALVLGAAVSPTDPTAAAGVFSRLRAPRRVVEIVEGESLVNDAVALVLLATAVGFLSGDAPTAGEVVIRLLLAVVVGVVVGAVVALLVGYARAQLSEPRASLVLSLVAPYASYFGAEHLYGSGILAAVTAGVLLGSWEKAIFTASSRLRIRPFWTSFDFLLSSTLFVFLGFQLIHVIPDRLSPGTLALQGVVVVAVVLSARFLWQVLVPPLAYRLQRLRGRDGGDVPHRERLLIAWCAPRGAVSLAAALSVPDVPGRDQVVFLAFVLVLFTLLQTSALPRLLRRFEPSDEDGEIVRLRQRLSEVALENLPPGAPETLRNYYLHRHDHVGADDDLRESHRRLVELQHEELDRHQDASPEAVRVLRYELDLEEERFG